MMGISGFFESVVNPARRFFLQVNFDGACNAYRRHGLVKRSAAEINYMLDQILGSKQVIIDSKLFSPQEIQSVEAAADEQEFLIRDWLDFKFPSDPVRMQKLIDVKRRVDAAQLNP